MLLEMLLEEVEEVGMLTDLLFQISPVLVVEEEGGLGSFQTQSLSSLWMKREATHFFQATALKVVEGGEEIQFQMMHWKVEEEGEMEVEGSPHFLLYYTQGEG